MRVSRVLLWAGSAILLAWGLVCVLTGLFAAESTLHPQRSPITPSDIERAQAVASSAHAQLTDAAVAASDRATLRAWSIVPAESNGNTVLLLHGQADNRAGMLGDAGMLLSHGYAVLLPDARAHGASDGTIATYGVLEADDIRRWFDWIKQTEHPRCIYGLGNSMGAAQLLESLTVETGFCAVVAESSFSSFSAIADDRMHQWFALRTGHNRIFFRPAVAFGFLYTRLKYGIDLSHASPIDAVAATSTPVLLIHGQADTKIPPYHSERIEDRHPAAALWEPPRASHSGAFQADPKGYENHVLQWFAQHNQPPAVLAVPSAR